MKKAFEKVSRLILVGMNLFIYAIGVTTIGKWLFEQAMAIPSETWGWVFVITAVVILTALAMWHLGERATYACKEMWKKRKKKKVCEKHQETHRAITENE